MNLQASCESNSFHFPFPQNYSTSKNSLPFSDKRKMKILRKCENSSIIIVVLEIIRLTFVFPRISLFISSRRCVGILVGISENEDYGLSWCTKHFMFSSVFCFIALCPFVSLLLHIFVSK